MINLLICALIDYKVSKKKFKNRYTQPRIFFSSIIIFLIIIPSVCYIFAKPNKIVDQREFIPIEYNAYIETEDICTFKDPNYKYFSYNIKDYNIHDAKESDRNLVTIYETPTWKTLLFSYSKKSIIIEYKGRK